MGSARTSWVQGKARALRVVSCLWVPGSGGEKAGGAEVLEGAACHSVTSREQPQAVRLPAHETAGSVLGTFRNAINDKCVEKDSELDCTRTLESGSKWLKEKLSVPRFWGVWVDGPRSQTSSAS